MHFLGKAATANLLYAFPLLLLGDGEGTVATLADVFGWAFAIWGTGLYWWAGFLYAYQVSQLMRTPRWLATRRRDRQDRAVHRRRQRAPESRPAEPPRAVRRPAHRR